MERDDSPLFTSAHAALVFALNFSAQCYERPTMNKLAQPAVGSGKGLIGLDGAAQAGFIRAELNQLPVTVRSILIARCAPKSTPCSCGAPCCTGKRINPEWFDATSVLIAASKDFLYGCFSHYEMRRGAVLRYLGEKISLEDIAESVGWSRNTVSSQNGKIGKALKEMESNAWGLVEDHLQNLGMVGKIE